MSRATLAGRSPLADYLNQIGPPARLTADEERSLAGRVASGDAEARDRLVRTNLRLVATIARDYLGRGLALDDLVGEGNLGLIRATESYDPDFGVRFGTYAAYWIKQSIRSAILRAGGAIRLPAYMATLLTKWRRAEASLAVRLGCTPSDSEVGASLGLSPRRLAMALAARDARNMGSGERDNDGGHEPPAAEDPGPTPFELVSAEDERTWLGSRLSRLDDRSAMVIRLRYGLDDGNPLKLREVGDRLGLTRERVRQLERRALATLATN